MPRPLVALLWLLLLTSCSNTPPLETRTANLSLTPEQVAEDGDRYRWHRVVWGGVIIESHNLERRTRLEILAYPLDDGLRPTLEKTAGKRFFAYQDGYLERMDYAAGRQITVVAKVRGNEQASVGEHPYRYPVVSIEQHHLWSTDTPVQKPQLHFGFGVVFGR